MRFIDLRHLSGPNVFTQSPVALARLELDELTGQETTGYPGFAARLARLLPGLAGHHCASGRPGGFLAAMDRGTYFGHVAEHVALELSSRAGREVSLGRTMWAGADGRYDVMMECPRDEPEDSPVPALLLRLAIRITGELLAGDWPDVEDDLAVISCVIERERLGVSTAAIAAAARRRGLPVRRVGGQSLLVLGYGRARRLVCAALTEQTSALGVDIAADKMLAKQLLAGAGIPVPTAVLADTAAEAAEALDRLGAPVVIKPLGGRQGRSVAVGVTSAAAAEAAFTAAAAAGSAVLVESWVPGRDYRVLVIDGQVAAAAELRPAAVTGDGEHTISQLVELANADPRRGEGHARPLTRIVLDDEVRRHLDAAGLDSCSVPATGQHVTLRGNANLSTGGTSRDVTDLVHPEAAALCQRAAAAVGLDVCGIDLRLADIAAPVSGAASGAVIEVNASPGLRMHLSPAEGRPRDVAAAIVDRLYPPGAPLRIPVISVTGTNGKTTTVRMIARVLGQAGLRTGMATTDGVWSGGRLVYPADASGPRSAQMVLEDPAAEAAVLETARGGIIRGGLGYDRADVAVVTNITADHLGDGGVDDLDELIHVKALVAEEIRPGGTVVLNADDPAAAGLAERPALLSRDPDIRFFTLRPGSGVAERHRRAGGTGYEVRDGEIVETRGAQVRPVLPVDSLPGAFGGRAAHVVANALAAVAACRAAGISVKDIRRGLAGFTPGEANPGRGNVYRAGEVPVIVDYGHNAAALHATGSMIAQVWGDTAGAGGWRAGTAADNGSIRLDISGNAAAGGGDRADWPGAAVAAVTLPGDRRDDLLAQTAEAIAAWFGAVVIYEDSDRRGRAPGEMQALIAGVLRRARPGMTCELADGPGEALRRAVALSAGAPVLFLYEKLAAARAALDAIGATPWPDAAPPAGTAFLAGGPTADLAAQVDAVLAAAGGTGAFPADASADYATGPRDDDDEPDAAPEPVPA